MSMIQGDEQLKAVLAIDAIACIAFWGAWHMVSRGWATLKTRQFNHRGRLRYGEEAEKWALISFVYGAVYFAVGLANLYLLCSDRPLRW